jgi:oxygen-independent coproporphyrinogen-3 oxidase
MPFRPRHVYIHVPFCARRCSYCDFAIAVRRVVPVDAYLDALRAELNGRFEAPGGDWPVATLYFGGGTPSKLGAAGVSRLMALLGEFVTLERGAEVTLETNPEDVTAEAAAAWREAGINRLSLGAQSFDDSVLQWMHRTHDAAATSRAVEIARSAGLENISLDLIFALPGEVPRDWQRDLELAMSLAVPHLSLYGLTVESSTPLGHWRDRGSVSEAPDERYEREFLDAHRRLGAAGYAHYEVSNYAREGRRSRHNASYWTGAAYAGLGPSSHEYDGTHRRWNAPAYADWSERVLRGEDPVAGSETLTPDNRSAERVYLGLRTSDGLQVGDSEREHAAKWIDAGWAELRGDRLLLTATGWLRLDALAADLTYVRSR